MSWSGNMTCLQHRTGRAHHWKISAAEYYRQLVVHFGNCQASISSGTPHCGKAAKFAIPTNQTRKFLLQIWVTQQITGRMTLRRWVTLASYEFSAIAVFFLSPLHKHLPNILICFPCAYVLHVLQRCFRYHNFGGSSSTNVTVLVLNHGELAMDLGH